MSTKPKRQKIAPPSRGDEGIDAPQHAKSHTARKKPSSAVAPPPTDPKQLYGLYSTDYADFCSGSWFPIKYVGPAPAAAPATEATDATVPASASSPVSAAAAGGVVAAPSPSGDDTILVRWSSRAPDYSAEPLSLSFVRCAGEFTRLPIASMKIGKRVLVRDVLEDLDFSGVSFWLATITGDPNMAKAPKGKKRPQNASQGNIAVAYQNTMWPATAVPLESIYVLPKLKAALELIPCGDEPVAAASEDSESDAEEQQEEEEEAPTAPEAAQRSMDVDVDATSETDTHEDDARSRPSSGLLAPPAEIATAPTAAAPFLSYSPPLGASPTPFAYSSPPLAPLHAPLSPLSEETKEHAPNQDDEAFA